MVIHSVIEQLTGAESKQQGSHTPTVCMKQNGSLHQTKDRRGLEDKSGLPSLVKCPALPATTHTQSAHGRTCRVN